MPSLRREALGDRVCYRKGVPTSEFTAFQVMFDIVLTSEQRHAGPSSVLVFAAINTLEDRCDVQTVAEKSSCLPSHH